MPLFTPQELAWFAAAALVLGCTPGPNMIYCLSRTLCQGRPAGLLSLAGVLAGFVVHVLATALGITAVLIAMPLAFDAVKLAGAAYLLWLAWRACTATGSPALQMQRLAAAPAARLFGTGFVVNLLNPKVALFYLALFPNFLQPQRGSLLCQSLQLGALQIAISGAVTLGLMLCVGPIRARLDGHGRWLSAQRYAMAVIFVALAVRILFLNTH